MAGRFAALEFGGRSGLERSGHPLSDYEIELQHMDSTISALEERARSNSLDREETTRRAAWLYRRASLTGADHAFGGAEAALDEALGTYPEWPDLWLLKAHLDYRFHRFADAQRAVEQLPELAESAAGRALLGDLDVEHGRYGDAQRVYAGVIREAPTWDNLARLAHLKAHLGDVDGAEELYGRAEDQITAKELRAYAWVQLQRGLLDRALGRYPDAAAHYEHANRAYSGYWLVKEHVAELLAATGHLNRAVALYGEVIAVSPRPDLHHAMGDLYTRLGRHEAAVHHDRAQKGYLASIARGQVHHIHHLAMFCAHVLGHRDVAIHWARRDVALRPNDFTRATLAHLERNPEAAALPWAAHGFFGASTASVPPR